MFPTCRAICARSIALARISCPSIWRVLGSFRRPRLVTVAVTLLVAAPMVLANLVEADHLVATRRDLPNPAAPQLDTWMIRGNHEMLANEYGWPWPWIWIDSAAPGPSFSPLSRRLHLPALAGNIAVWMAIILAVSLVTQAIVRRRPAGVRFSLRATLVVTAILASALGWYVSGARRIALEDEVVRLAPKFDKVTYFDLRGPRWLKVIGLSRHFDRLAGAEIYAYGNFDEVIELLERCTDLRYLSICTDDFTPRGIEGLGRLGMLDELWIEGLTDWSPRTVQSLSNLTHLRTLAVDRSWRRSRDVRLPDTLRDLETLSLDCTLAPETWATIGELPKLRTLEVELVADPSSAQVDDKTWQALQSLHLFNGWLNESQAKWIASLPNLRRLDIRSAKVDLPTLSILICRSCPSGLTIAVSGLNELERQELAKNRSDLSATYTRSGCYLALGDSSVEFMRVKPSIPWTSIHELTEPRYNFKCDGGPFTWSHWKLGTWRDVRFWDEKLQRSR